MSDDEVIRRRLIIDGDGTGDDRRLNILLKNLIKWTNNTDESTTENQQLYDRMLAQISQSEFAVRRAQLLNKTGNNQLNKYRELQEKLEGQIDEVKDVIELGKHNLAQAKILKQNRMLYDILAKSIKDEPARKDTDKRLSDLKAELASLEDQSKSFEQKLDTRRKLFHVLISSANQLQGILEDAKEEEAISTSFDDIENSPEPEPMSE